MNNITGWFQLVLALAAIFLVIAFCREVTCWYFKTSNMVDELSKARAILAEIRDALKSEPKG